MSAPANVGVVGLAAMGASLARNLARHGNAVAIYNRHYSRTEKLMEELGIPAERRLQGLGSNQMAALKAALS